MVRTLRNRSENWFVHGDGFAPPLRLSMHCLGFAWMDLALIALGIEMTGWNIDVDDAWISVHCICWILRLDTDKMILLYNIHIT